MLGRLVLVLVDRILVGTCICSGSGSTNAIGASSTGVIAIGSNSRVSSRAQPISSFTGSGSPSSTGGSGIGTASGSGSDAAGVGSGAVPGPDRVGDVPSWMTPSAARSIASIRRDSIRSASRWACADRADRAGLVVRLGDDHLGLAPRLLAHVARGLLGGDERLGQQVLAPAQLGQLLLERLHLVGELASLAPRRLEALGDLLDHLLDRRAVVAEQAPPDFHVSQLDWCVGHGSPFRS